MRHISETVLEALTSMAGSRADLLTAEVTVDRIKKFTPEQTAEFLICLCLGMMQGNTIFQEAAAKLKYLRDQ